MISLGNILPLGFGNTDIFLEFRRMLEVSNSKILSTYLHNVQFRLWNLVLFGARGSESEQKLLERVQEIYEFLINEKYSNQKTGNVFQFSFEQHKNSPEICMDSSRQSRRKRRRSAKGYGRLRSAGSA